MEGYVQGSNAYLKQVTVKVINVAQGEQLQTFLPLPDFAESARVLDNKRLRKQLIEGHQILYILCGSSRNVPWGNHPAVIMWEDHVPALGEYIDACHHEWVEVRRMRSAYYPTKMTGPKPYWFGDEAFHAAHRSNLLRKDYLYYSAFDWREPTSLDYIWPQSPLQRVAQ